MPIGLYPTSTRLALQDDGSKRFIDVEAVELRHQRRGGCRASVHFAYTEIIESTIVRSARADAVAASREVGGARFRIAARSAATRNAHRRRHAAGPCAANARIGLRNRTGRERAFDSYYTATQERGSGELILRSRSRTTARGWRWSAPARRRSRIMPPASRPRRPRRLDRGADGVARHASAVLSVEVDADARSGYHEDIVPLTMRPQGYRAKVAAISGAVLKETAEADPPLCSWPRPANGFDAIALATCSGDGQRLPFPSSDGCALPLNGNTRR
jgi:hypothetical protein